MCWVLHIPYSLLGRLGRFSAVLEKRGQNPYRKRTYRLAHMPNVNLPPMGSPAVCRAKALRVCSWWNCDALLASSRCFGVDAVMQRVLDFIHQLNLLYHKCKFTGRSFSEALWISGLTVLRCVFGWCIMVISGEWW